MHMLLLLGAGLLAGAMNAIAGGGSFITFPSLVFLGLPSVAANASSTVALFPAALASAWAFRAHLGAGVGGVRLPPLLATSLAGGLCGALLLLFTPSRIFDAVVPWLLLLATLAFAFGREAGAALRRRFRIGPTAMLAVQFLLSVYGGYFGGAVGLMMMAVWSLLSAAELKALNPAKVVLVATANAAAIACFVAAGAIRWPETSVMLAGAVAGGYAGARLSTYLSARTVRLGVTAVTVAITIAFFLRSYG